MNRPIWLAINVALIILAISAGWFAVNAPKVARPTLAPLGAVALPAENPLLPPAPFARTAGDDAGLLSARDLFSDKAMTRFSAARSRGPGRKPQNKDLPRAQTLGAPPTTPSIRPPKLAAEAIDPEDRVQMRLTGVQPEVLQYFGSHLIPKTHREPDLEGAPNAVVPAPAYGVEPRGNPRGPAAGLGRPKLAEPEAGVATAAAPAPAEVAASDPSADNAIDGLILISVLRNRSGGGRALIRTPQASALAVTLGEEIVGWRVSSIGEDYINLRRGSQTRVLRMPQ